MKINQRDFTLLTAFIEREADDFKWKSGQSRAEYVNRTLSRIVGGLAPIEQKADFITVESLTNLGLTERSLSLTPAPGDWSPKGYVRVLLPVSQDKQSRPTVKWTL